MTCFRPFSFSSHTFLVHLILILYPVLQLKLYAGPLLKKTHNTQTVLLSESLNASVYTSQTQVCTRKRCFLCLHSSLRNQGWHSCVNDAVQSSSSPTSLLLPSQYTNPIPRLAVWCGNSIHISCQPERFLGLTHVLHGWGEQITQHLYPLL